MLIGKIYLTDSTGQDIHGNAVNITFRIEGVNSDQFINLEKEFPATDRILCTKEFYDETDKETIPPGVKFVRCGNIQVKGISEPIETYFIETAPPPPPAAAKSDFTPGKTIKITVYI